MTETVLFGGGCFWCTEAVFKMLQGVTSVLPGYAGGAGIPTYESVSGGLTGHVEVVEVTYDPLLVPFKTLLTIFFASHDATQVNKQGNDVGTQYRSVIFYTTPTQQREAAEFIGELEASAASGKPIATTIEPLEKFYQAESYHLDYFNRNKTAGYCQIIIAPKLQKVQEKYAELLTAQAMQTKT